MLAAGVDPRDIHAEIDTAGRLGFINADQAAEAKKRYKINHLGELADNIGNTVSEFGDTLTRFFSGKNGGASSGNNTQIAIDPDEDYRALAAASEQNTLRDTYPQAYEALMSANGGDRQEILRQIRQSPGISDSAAEELVRIYLDRTRGNGKLFGN